ncbi:MAG: CvpA family protein [Gammaproteobacteria bacterium]|nr:CvpA family protein [Gammaproteobacteria bacterium]
MIGEVSGLDIAIVVVLVISAIISVIRGFVREAMSLVAWFASIWVAIAFARPMSTFLESYISTASLRVPIAFTALFFITLLLLTLVSVLLSQLVKRSHLSGFDRTIGLVFGLVRGGVIVALLVFLIGMTPFTKQVWWRDSHLAGKFQTVAAMMRHSLPPDFASN